MKIRFHLSLYVLSYTTHKIHSNLHPKRRTCFWYQCQTRTPYLCLLTRQQNALLQRHPVSFEKEKILKATKLSRFILLFFYFKTGDR